MMRHSVIAGLFAILVSAFVAPVHAAPTKVDLAPLSRIVVSGQNTVASAGTAEVLGSSAAVASCLIRANTGNSNNIYVGPSTVDSTGFILDAGEAIAIDVDDVADIYIDADTSSDGVSYLCVR